jgi:hypothetical protein
MTGLLGLSLFTSIVDKEVRRAPGMRWADLVAWLTRPVEAMPAEATPGWARKAEKDDPPNDRRKASLPLWSLVTYYEGGWPEPAARVERGKARVQWVWGLGLDYDDGTTLAEMLDVWGGWCGVWHTTWKHREGAPRWRGVLPFSRPVHAEVWPAVFAWAQRLAGGRLDPATKDCSRAWYVPARGPYAPFESRVVRGPRLVVPAEVVDHRQALPKPRPKRAAPVASSVPLRQAERVFAERLKVEPGLREWAGEALGGRAGGGRVTGVRCPDCNRPSLWWPLDPKGTPKAMCSHRNSCGAHYWIDELIGRAGVRA